MDNPKKTSQALSLIVITLKPARMPKRKPHALRAGIKRISSLPEEVPILTGLLTVITIALLFAVLQANPTKAAIDEDILFEKMGQLISKIETTDVRSFF